MFSQNGNATEHQLAQMPQFYAVPTVPVEIVQTSNSFAARAILSEQDLGTAKSEIMRLESQLARMRAAEAAFTEIVERDDSLFVVDKAGRLIEILSHPIAEVIHFVPAPPFSGGELYEITLEGVAVALRLTAEKYYNDRQFLQALSELPGVRVSFLRRSVGLTATTLRLAFARKSRVVTPHFWGGWRHVQESEFYFYLSNPGGKTHTTNSAFTKYVPLAGFPSNAEAEVSFRNLWNVALAPVKKLQVRWLIALSLHVACLYSLLHQLKQPFEGTFCFFSDDAAVLEFLKTLFQWNEDPALSLDEPPASFNLGMLERKDEPLLILDRRSTVNAKTNSAQFEEILRTAQVSWKGERGEQFFPLQALPVILSAAMSSLVCASQVLVVDLDVVDLDIDLWVNVSDSIPDIVAEYLKGFAQFTQHNIPVLQELLETKRREVFCNRYGLSACNTQIMGVLLAMNAYVGEYLDLFRIQLPEDARNEDLLRCFLLELLRDTTERENSCVDFVGQFVAVVRADLASHVLHAQPRHSEAAIYENTVFYTDDFLYFSSGAFRFVSKRLSCSQPTLLHALAEANLLRGTPINGSTKKTRIRVPNADGTHRTMNVYAFPREVFDSFGDPLIFKEEGTA